MLWHYNARSFPHLHHMMAIGLVPAPTSYRQPVSTARSVAPEVRDAPKPSVVVTESAVSSVTIVSPLSGTSFAPAPDASECVATEVQTPVTVSALPGRESTSTPEIPVIDCFAPNPYTGYVPEPNGVVELGHGHPPRYEMWRIGNVLACELCGGVKTRTREKLKTHRESEGHLFERERQRLWSVKCVICDRICDGLKCFDDHLAGKKHRRRVEMINVEVKGFCHGFFCDHEDCKK